VVGLGFLSREPFDALVKRSEVFEIVELLEY